MHIAIVRSEFNRARGGAERYAVSLAQRWLAAGHRVSVVCTKHQPEDAKGISIVKVSRPKLFGPFRHRWFSYRAGRAARASGADVVVCLARAWPGDLLRLGDGLHRPWMGVRYPDLESRKKAHLNPRHRELLKLEAALFAPSRFGLYVANSEMVKRQAVHMYGVDPERVRVIPNGVDRVRFNTAVREKRRFVREAHGIDDVDPVILFSGMDYRRKGLDAAVAGFIDLAQSYVGVGRPRLVCVGRGRNETAVSALEKTGLTAQTSFLPPSDAIENWYGAADLLLLPTMHDPSANAVTEALACGLPVITSGENGARQHIRAGANGYVLTNRVDRSEIARHALDLLENPRDPREVVAASGLISEEENASRVLEAAVEAAKLRAGAGQESTDAAVIARGAPPETAARTLAKMHRAGRFGVEESAKGLDVGKRTGEGTGKLRLSDVLPDLRACRRWMIESGANRPARLRALRAYLWALGRPFSRAKIAKALVEGK